MAVWTADTPYACGWTMDDDCASCRKAVPCSGPGLPQEEADAVFQNCVNMAAEILYALSGRQFGLCEITVRPCRKACCDPCQDGPRWTPVLQDGQWINVSCNSCGDSCSCPNVCEIALPGPVDSITEIRVDGQVLPPSAYRIDNRRYLVALERPVLDEEGNPTGESERFCWPTCQDMTAPATEPNTWEVTYLRGLPIPEAGRRALAELACELCLACLNDSSCRLPKRVTTITRDGVTMALLDPQTFISEGLTGLYGVDLWIRSVNPRGLPRQAAILSPDMKNMRRTTWP